MKASASAWSFGKTKKLELERTDKRYTPGPGMYSHQNNLSTREKAPTWR